jgi:hypothetical protein
MKKYRQLKTTEVKPLREKLHQEQNMICPILQQEYSFEEMALDHLHKQRKADDPEETDTGLIRGCINIQANIVLGKIENSWKRTGLADRGHSLSDALRRMADYLENEPLPLIHPSEKIPVIKFKKSSYNKLVKKIKETDPNKKIPPYPKRQVLTKELKTLFEKYNVEVEYYKKSLDNTSE